MKYSALFNILSMRQHVVFNATNENGNGPKRQQELFLPSLPLPQYASRWMGVSRVGSVLSEIVHTGLEWLFGR